MIKISSKSKRHVLRLLKPPTSKTGIDAAPSRRLTVRQLMHHQRYRKLRERATIIRVEGDHLLSVGNLIRDGFDYSG